MVLKRMYLDAVIGERAVAATLVDVVTLLLRRANTPYITTEGGTAALRLHLVILEDEERIRARNKGGSTQRHIW